MAHHIRGVVNWIWAPPHPFRVLLWTSPCSSTALIDHKDFVEETEFLMVVTNLPTLCRFFFFRARSLSLSRAEVTITAALTMLAPTKRMSLAIWYGEVSRFETLRRRVRWWRPPKANPQWGVLFPQICIAIVGSRRTRSTWLVDPFEPPRAPNSLCMDVLLSLTKPRLWAWELRRGARISCSHLVGLSMKPVLRRDICPWDTVEFQLKHERIYSPTFSVRSYLSSERKYAWSLQSYSTGGACFWDGYRDSWKKEKLEVEGDTRGSNRRRGQVNR